MKEIILEELNEMYVTDIAGSDEDRAIDRHRAAKRARGEYPPRPEIHSSYEPPSEDQMAKINQARREGMVQTIRNLVSQFGSMMVDPATYDAVAELAPELLDKLSLSRSRRQK